MSFGAARAAAGCITNTNSATKQNTPLIHNPILSTPNRTQRPDLYAQKNQYYSEETLSFGAAHAAAESITNTNSATKQNALLIHNPILSTPNQTQRPDLYALKNQYYSEETLSFGAAHAAAGCITNTNSATKQNALLIHNPILSTPNRTQRPDLYALKNQYYSEETLSFGAARAATRRSGSLRRVY